MRKKDNAPASPDSSVSKIKTAPLHSVSRHEKSTKVWDGSKTKFTFYINEELMKDCKILAIKKGKNFSSFVEEALIAFLKNEL